MNQGAVDLAVGQWSSEFADQGIFTTDERLVITSWNRWLERHSGLAARDMVGRPLREALPALEERGLDERYRDALHGRAHILSHLLHGHLLPMPGRIEARTMPQRVRIAPLQIDGSPAGTITVIEDVSERVASEHELHRQIAAQRAARKAAENAVRVKDDFLAMLGHELRNPLAPILTATQILKMRGGGTLDRECAIITRQVEHLVALVNDLLDISRITRGQLELHRAPVAIATVVEDAVAMTASLMRERRHTVTVTVPDSQDLVVDGDAERLVQALVNLLTNAATYSEPGGAISVVTVREDGDVVLRVRDTGIGMDAEMLATVFEPFVQGHQDLARTRGGLGLGLAIVSSVIAQHGGSVAVTSAGQGHGSEFSIRLPLIASAQAVSPSAGEAPVCGEEPLRVLIVDDNEDGAMLLAEMLSIAGYSARYALDGLSALSVAEAFDPDVAILDIGLPTLDGYELARRFAAHPKLARTRLVALTGYGQEPDRRRSTEAGFTAHLLKPVDFPELQESLRQDVRGDAAAKGLR